MMTALILSVAAAASAVQNDSVPLYDDLGDHHHRITTKSQATQQYFDQGLRLVYAFNHAEAVASFHQALATDESCAMCWWGAALALGPNINLGMDEPAAVDAWHAIGRAKALAANVSPVESAFIDALALRYAADPKAPRPPLDSAYARAMRELTRQFPGDDDAAVLYAAAVMNLSPWLYWNTDMTPRPGIPDVLDVLERVSSRNPEHAGACHLYIHAVEAAQPKRAEPCADRLAGLMPGAGHIVHMPGHIYIRVGRFADAITANQHAIHSDETFIQDRDPSGAYPLGYYPHNFHFLNFAAMMAANREIAYQSAADLAAKSAPELLGVPGLGGAIQHYHQALLFAYIRFEDWNAILHAPAPPQDFAYPTGLWRYARGLAFARTGDTHAARWELNELKRLAARPELENLYILGYNSARSVLSVARQTLAGEIAAARGDMDKAIARLKAAVAIEDAFIYMEPPEWPIPPRQHLARVMAFAGDHDAAIVVWQQDLERFPENVWSLRGLAQSFAIEGRTEEAAAVHLRLAKALAGSGGAKPHGH
jgi:tetratricopeptide (TPR) repeat protein